MKARLRREQGSVALEFAIMVPLLSLLLAGMIELGSIAGTAVVARNAAREGARYASLASTNPDAATAAVDYLSTALAGRTDVVLPTTGQVSISGGAAIGDPITVSLPVQVIVGFPMLQSVLGASITVTGQATMELTQ